MTFPEKFVVAMQPTVPSGKALSALVSCIPPWQSHSFIKDVVRNFSESMENQA
jgi:hypothetical protein